jgi:hypothetical protein
MASVLVGGGSEESAVEESAAAPGVEQELAAVKAELVTLRELMESMDRRLRPAAPSTRTNDRGPRAPDLAPERGP